MSDWMPAVLRLLQKMPVKRRIMIPFSLLRKFAPHEQQLLAGMTKHEGVVGPQVAQSAATDLPGIRPRIERLPCTTSSCGQRQNEILGECVVEAENDIAVMMLAVDLLL